MTTVRMLDAESRGTLAELLNLGVGRAADILTELTGASVELQVSAVRISAAGVPGAAVVSEPPSPETIITQAFAGSLRGRASLCFATSSGIALAKALSGRLPTDNTELDSELSGVLLEVGNIVLNGVMGSLSYVLPADLRYALPELHTPSGRGHPLQADPLCGGNVLLGDLSIRTPQQTFDGTIAIACALGGIHELLESLLEPMPAT